MSASNALLSQLVTFPTHYSQHSGHASALDLVITNHPLLLSNLSTAAPLGTSDHDIVLARLQLQGQRDTRSVAIPDEPSQFNFSSFDTSLRACEEWSLVGQCLSTIDWFSELQIPLGNPSHSVDLLNHNYTDEHNITVRSYAPHPTAIQSPTTFPTSLADINPCELRSNASVMHSVCTKNSQHPQIRPDTRQNGTTPAISPAQSTVLTLTPLHCTHRPQHQHHGQRYISLSDHYVHHPASDSPQSN